MRKSISLTNDDSQCKMNEMNDTDEERRRGASGPDRAIGNLAATEIWHQAPSVRGARTQRCRFSDTETAGRTRRGRPRPVRQFPRRQPASRKRHLNFDGHGIRDWGRGQSLTHSVSPFLPLSRRSPLMTPFPHSLLRPTISIDGDGGATSNHWHAFA